MIPDPHAPTRDAFRRAFREYTEQSAQMQSLLLSLSEEPSERRRPVIDEKQKRVDAARESYLSAREQYMRDVLGVIIPDGNESL